MIPSLHTGTVRFSKSEEYLAHLAQKTFLSFWSHPNLFRAQNRELADLIVIFDQDIVIFSDKSCEFKVGEHGWGRWYRKVILNSANQLHRAAAWIRKHPTEIYMDAKCERHFPLHVPSNPSIHLVAVATGVRAAAEQHFDGDGTLMLHTDADGSTPFMIGDLDRAKDFVHVFADASFTAVLSERDTISDFVTYLRKRAAFLRSGPEILADSELALLAHYFRNAHDGEHEFAVDTRDVDPSLIYIPDDWSFFAQSIPYKRKKAADAESYVWDDIIEAAARQADQGRLVRGRTGVWTLRC